jgi:polyhydroxybutyrate depolymerase
MLVAATLSLAGCGGSTAAATTLASPSPTQIGHVTVGGQSRSYVVYRPLSLARKQTVPLVIALHGYMVDSTWMETTTHYDDLAKTAGFVVLYPQGNSNSWNAGTCCAQNHDDDVGFIRAVIDRLMSIGGIDRARIFVTGMSNGGAMAQRLACELSDRITAVASVSGSLLIDACNPSRAISVMEMHGTLDSLVPFEGGSTRGLGSFPPTMSIMKRWAALDGCAAAPTVTQSGLASLSTWTGCRDGSSVVLDAIAGADHSWFAPENMPGQPDATHVTWDFFSHSPPLL